MTEVRRATPGDLADAARLRAELHPDEPASLHLAELREQQGDEDAVLLVAPAPSGGLLGFAEATLRHDYVSGCTTSPVAFLEAIYVDPSARRAGVARALVAAVVAWGRAKGCTELGSDALIDNEVSHRMHEALGFAEVERVVSFRRDLED